MSLFSFTFFCFSFFAHLLHSLLPISFISPVSVFLFVLFVFILFFISWPTQSSLRWRCRSEFFCGSISPCRPSLRTGMDPPGWQGRPRLLLEARLFPVDPTLQKKMVRNQLSEVPQTNKLIDQNIKSCDEFSKYCWSVLSTGRVCVCVGLF